MSPNTEPPVVPVYLGVGEQWFDDYCPHHLVAGAWQSGDQITFGFVAAFAVEQAPVHLRGMRRRQRRLICDHGSANLPKCLD